MQGHEDSGRGTTVERQTEQEFTMAFDRCDCALAGVMATKLEVDSYDLSLQKHVYFLMSWPSGTAFSERGFFFLNK